MTTIKGEKFEKRGTTWIVDGRLRATEDNIDIFFNSLNDPVIDSKLQEFLHSKRQKRKEDSTDITKLILDTIKTVLHHLIEESKK